MSPDGDAGAETVLHLIDTDGPGGAETIYVALAKGLAERGWRSISAMTAEGWSARELRRQGIEPRIVRSGSGWDIRYLWRLRALIKEEGVDLVQAHLLGSALYGSVAARLSGIPAVATFHGGWDLRNSGALPGVKMRVLSRSLDAGVFVSPSLCHQFSREAPSLSVPGTVIPNGIDVSRFHPRRTIGEGNGFRTELGVGPGEFLVGTVGNLRPAKAHRVFLRVASRLCQADDGYRFVLVGEASETDARDLRAMRDEFDLGDRLFLTGFRDDVARIMSSLDAFLLTSRSEGFSLTTVEAMASGLPVIATRCGGPEEIIEHGRTGLLVDVGNTREMARLVEKVRSSPDLRRDIGRAARDHVARNYSRSRMIDSYAALYFRLLRRARVDPGH